MKRTLSLSTALVSLCSLLGTALAANFPDVSTSHLHKTAIDYLVNRGVISGNPDGKFYPDKGVNRAEFLKMIYKARNRIPDASRKKCFGDVEEGSWYETYVCDAVSRGYVGGYPDKSFKPGSPVNRVEALKMIALVFGIDTPKVEADNQFLAAFNDVSLNAWYAPYISAAYAWSILPIPGQHASIFAPDRPLLRSEAAAYIYNTLNKVKLPESSSSSSAATRSSRSSTASTSGAVIKEASVPFSTTGAFIKKSSYTYLFPIARKETIEVVANIDGQGGLSCRLYLLDVSGFSDQYYLGHEEGGSCHILATLSPGSYQLQLQPTVADTTFMIDVHGGSGDNNDGFVQAPKLKPNAVGTYLLDSRDIYDLYMFSVGSEGYMTVEFSNTENVKCLVYAMKDVDIFGFSGPECNERYAYRPGTYYVMAKRMTTLGSKHNYTVKLAK